MEEIITDFDPSKLKIPVIHQEEVIKACVMNQKLLKSKKEVAYICKNCPDKMENICRFCIENCHRPHLTSGKVDQLGQELVNFENKPCQCALNGHKVKPISKTFLKEDSSKKKESSNYCPLNAMFSLSKPKYYYKRRDQNKVYCLYCMYFSAPEEIGQSSGSSSQQKVNPSSTFLGLNLNKPDPNASAMLEESFAFDSNIDLNNIYEKIEMNYSNDEEELPHCYCELKNHKHQISQENIVNMKILFQNINKCTTIDPVKLAYSIFTHYDFIRTYLSEFVIIEDKIIEAVSNDNLENYLDSNNDNPRSDRNAKQKNSSSVKEGSDNFRNLNLEEKMDWESYNESFSLIVILSSFVEHLENLNIPVLNEKMKEFFNYQTISKLLTFRSNLPVNMLRIQRLSVKMYTKFNLGLHLKYKSFNDVNFSPLHRFILLSRMDQSLIDEGLSIVDKIFTLCQGLSESSKIPPRHLNLMYVEGLKILKIIIPNIGHDFKMLKEIHKKIEDTIWCLKDKKDGQYKVIHSLEKISKLMIILINDYNFYQKIVEKKSIDYSFINNEFNMNIIQTLFTFGAVDNSQYVLDRNFYDIYVNHHDSYIESMESIINSDSCFGDEKIASQILDFIKERPKDNTMIDSLKKDLEAVISSLKSVLDNKMTTEKYFSIITDYLSNFYTTFKEKILTKENAFTTQVLFTQKGLLEKLLILLSLTFRMMKICINLEEENSPERLTISNIEANIYKSFKNVLRCIAQDNPLVSTIFFNSKIINLILGESPVGIRFYVDQLKVLKAAKYTIDTEELTRFVVNNLIGNNFENIKDYFAQSEQTLILFNLILQVSTKKSILMVNNLIATKLKVILDSNEFKICFLEENTEKNTKIISLVLKCINHLQKEYFYLINSGIRELLLEKMSNEHTPPKLNKICVKTYFNCVVKSHFLIVDIKKYFSHDSTVFVNLIENSGEQEGHIDDLSDGFLVPLLKVLSDFKTCYYSNKSVFDGSLKFTLSYFEEAIFLPAIYSIYRVIYCSSEITKHLKYVIYNIIYLYLMSFKFLLEIVRKYDLSNEENSGIFLKYFDTTDINLLSNTLESSIGWISNDKSQLLNTDVLMKHFVDNIVHIKKYLESFKQDEEEDKDKKQEQDQDQDSENFLLDDSKSVKSHDKSAKEVKNNEEKSLLELLKEETERYLDLKENYEENNILKDIFSEEEHENIQKIITLDLIERLNFLKADSILGQETTNDIFRNLKSELFKQLGGINKRFSRKNSNNVLKRQTIQRDDPKFLDQLGDYFNPFINIYLEQKTSPLETICKLFKTNPGFWQKIIVDKSNLTRNIIDIFIEKQIPFLVQLIFIEFNRLDCDNTPYYDILLNMLEFLRLLCEDHNPIFQTLLINYEIAVKPESKNDKGSQFMSIICNLPIWSLNNLEHSEVVKGSLEGIRRIDDDYFSPLVEKVTEFLIEIMQGTYPGSFEDLIKIKDPLKRNSFELYFKKHVEFLNFGQVSSGSENILANYFKVLNCFIEENSNPFEVKKRIIDELSPLKLITVSLNSFERLINNYIKQGVYPGCHEKLLQRFIEDYEDFTGDAMFTIATELFKYFKRVSTYKLKDSGSQINQFLQSISIIDNSEDITKETKSILLKKEYYVFCSKLIKDNEITFTEDKSMDEKEVYRYKDFFFPVFKEKVIDDRNNNSSKKTNFETIFFMVHPDSLFIEPNDTKTFLEKALYTNSNVKLNCILNYYPKLLKLIEMRKVLNKNKLLLLLFELPYSSLEMYNGIFSVITNILLVFSEFFDFPKRILIPFVLTHLVLLGLIIINWFSFQVLMHRKYEKDKLTFYDKLKLFANSMFDMEIFWFVWTMVFGFLAMWHPMLRFLFSFELLTIINISPTMKSIFIAVRRRYNQFLSAGFILVVVILCFSSLTIYSFKVSDDHDILCSSYLECFLYLINTGLRSGGLPFETKIKEQPGYWSEFFFTWTFYFIVFLLILNMLIGIIVDTFQELSEQDSFISEQKFNVCFICSIHRSNFQIKGINFDYHTQYEHNIDNYFSYLIKILMTDEHDLNSIDFQVFNAIKQKKIEFFPIKKAKSLE